MSPHWSSPTNGTVLRKGVAPFGSINGALIDTVRRNLGVTLEQHANICGIPLKSMKSICRGKVMPNGEHLLRIVVLGGVNPRLLEIDGWRRTS